MKLSEDTLLTLKNYATINSNIVIKDDGMLRTMSEAKNVLASASIVEKFGGTFGIYDLGEFLSVHSMFEDPDLVFDEDMNSVTMKEGRSAVKYFFSDPEILTSPTKDIQMPSSDVSFTLSSSDLGAIRKAASALGAAEFVVTKEGDTIVGIVTDTKNNTSNSFTLELNDAKATLDEFKFVFSIANFKLSQGVYDVEISSKLISKFSCDDGLYNYFIALEKSSTVGS